MQAVRNGFIMAIPVLLLGSFALILKSLPITAYQTLIQTLGGGFLKSIFEMVYNATFGLLSVFVTCTVSVARVRADGGKDDDTHSAAVIALACFAICSGFLQTGFATDAFGVKGMFTAIFSALVSSNLYLYLKKHMTKRLAFYTDGADANFNNAMGNLGAAMLILSAFAVFNLALGRLFHVGGFHQLTISGATFLFHNMGRSLWSGLLFVFSSSLLWFFGIHGSDVLEEVSQSIFAAGMEVNAAAIAAGSAPTEIFTKTFFDVFVLMGGCGASLCILLSILLFSRQKGTRGLAEISVLPMLFNINEPMVFGLPIVFNPILFLPFLLTPMVLTLTSWAAMSLGLVPVARTAVEWTTPILMGGYLATDSVAGALLQVFNLVVGVCIYRPFVLLHDREKVTSAHRHLKTLLSVLQDAEAKNIQVELMSLKGGAGNVAKMLAADLKYAVAERELCLYYQPQYDFLGRLIGAEALLRWKHPVFGMVYPPLLIELAKEMDLLETLERSVFSMAAEDLAEMRPLCRSNFALSVNVDATTLGSEGFLKFLQRLVEEGKVLPQELWIEITERTALFFHAGANEALDKLKQMGYCLAIDDFSMGFTSMKYLQENQFSMVKLDGSLVRGVSDNPRCRDIISSIVSLSYSLGFSVLAEYVETEEQRKQLEEIGCLQYQGYLFHPALPKEAFLSLLKTEKAG